MSAWLADAAHNSNKVVERAVCARPRPFSPHSRGEGVVQSRYTQQISSPGRTDFTPVHEQVRAPKPFLAQSCSGGPCVFQPPFAVVLASEKRVRLASNNTPEHVELTNRAIVVGYDLVAHVDTPCHTHACRRRNVRHHPLACCLCLYLHLMPRR